LPSRTGFKRKIFRPAEKEEFIDPIEEGMMLQLHGINFIVIETA
jgi:hypothetical protein